MSCYRITKYNPKYNPKYRNSEDHYMGDEWTAISDIGKIYNDKEFTMSDYLIVEEKYFEAVKGIMDEAKLEILTVKELEKNRYSSKYSDDSDELKGTSDSLNEEISIKNCDIALVVKLILREIIWAKLVSKSFEVHFGYDYYMFICSSETSRKSITQINENGLFVEKLKSPYF